ncbi:hypothetical protein DICPUDRAFT_160401 [Dictyostelium purpureum]|uniref:Cyclin N-terminal domain-containing protein n=1 Tax=Dictyostelium purpureum TaxID=5786 RepID=F1A6A2_DICPU|nr:uncharacterized protein DICPUDRAFT_160401 [Dictyostelium purpureum]EGC28276.1 hypothetical protein DICPUDRAFT_160401 [Dictyostelium purpureum]|eukprot:XP_003295196.1 hypothetical protein DICPUDRAFT_160401 [Dictyostelium purpureum]
MESKNNNNNNSNNTTTTTQVDNKNINNTQPPKTNNYQRMFRRLLQMRSSQPKTVCQEKIIASYKVYGWLISYDPAYESTAFRNEVLLAIDEIFDIVLAILDMMKCSSNLLIPIIMYADKFVTRSGIKHNQLFNLLLTSTVVSLKFWSESTQVNNAIIAEIFNFSLKDMNLMERRFLLGVDYNLFLNSTHVNNFLIQLYENQNIFLSSFKHQFVQPQIFVMPADLAKYQQTLIHKKHFDQLQLAQKQHLEKLESQKKQHEEQIQNFQQQKNNIINNNNINNTNIINNNTNTNNINIVNNNNNINLNNNNTNINSNSYNNSHPTKKQLTNQRYQHQQASNQQQQLQQKMKESSINYHVQMVSPMC